MELKTILKLHSSHRTEIVTECHQLACAVAILACKSWWGKKMHDSKATTQHNTNEYINCNITVTNAAHKLLGPT